MSTHPSNRLQQRLAMKLQLRQRTKHRESAPSVGRRTGIFRWQVLLLSGCLTAAAWPVANAQQVVDLSVGPTDYTTWTKLGSASANNFTSGGYNYSVLNLTEPGTGGQAGAAFAPDALNLDFNQAFSFHFNWYISSVNPGDLRGDGMTFTLSTAPALGGTGSDLGYGGLPSSSVALAIDTFHFSGEPVSPSLQILTAGNSSPVAHVTTDLGDAIRNTEFQWFGQLNYDPSGLNDNRGTLTARIENLNLGSFSVAADVDFGTGGLDMSGAPIFYGFTAGNGAALDGHATSWGALAPVPEPGTWALMALGLLGLGQQVRRQAQSGRRLPA